MRKVFCHSLHVKVMRLINPNTAHHCKKQPYKDIRAFREPEIRLRVGYQDC